MSGTLITFETAKLAKEAGINEPCALRYNEVGDITATKLGMHCHPNSYKDSFAAYSQEFLSNILRNMYNIDIPLSSDENVMEQTLAKILKLI